MTDSTKNNTTSPIKHRLPVTTLFFASLAMGIAVLGLSFMDYRKELKNVTKLFEAHVASAVRIITESAEEGAASTSLIYDITEKKLLESASFLADSNMPPNDRHVVWISSDKREIRYAGHWAGLEGPAQETLTDYLHQFDPGILVDDGPLIPFGLACIRKEADLRFYIYCEQAVDLKAHRKAVGIGPLLKGVVQKDIRYVALQDETGIIAVAPSAEPISPWNQDSFLSQAIDNPIGEAVFRTRILTTETAETTDTIFEGVVPYVMVDDSVVLLRVGIDATLLTDVQNSAKRRFISTTLLVCVALLLTSIIYFLVKKWQKKQALYAARLQTEADSRKHWEDIGQMAATVAHEVRNPLNTIGMITQRMSLEFTIQESEQEDFKEMTGILISEGKRVEKVVTDFLALGKPLNLKIESVHLPDLLDEASAPYILKSNAETVQIAVNDVVDTTVQVDVERFKQMIGNLIQNAMDAVYGHGHITISADRNGSEVGIHIEDDGPGLTDEQLDKVLKPFVSFKSNGTGLGLPLVNRMTSAHGGRLVLKRNSAQGLTVSLYLKSEA